nr:urate hydroxylase PuuD [Bacteroidota bacterium]
MEWLNLILRWTHVVFGIAWIGASFYFIFLENSLNRTENLRDELAGNLWAIHGGGFYYVEKYKSAPPILPKHLHWFKYEAYFTWLSGFLLLTLVYFMNAKAMMLDSSISNIDETTAVFIGLGSLVVGWLIYDVMCHTALLQKKKLFGIIGFAIVVLVSYILCQFLNGRAAFILVGALLGTIMAGNVFFCIIPSQKALVAAKANQPVNPELGKIAIAFACIIITSHCR